MSKYVPLIDVSRWQGDINWAKVKRTGINGAYIRAFNGQTVDPMLKTNTKNATVAGVAHGLYTFWQPDSDPITQAKLLVDAHYDYKSKFVPMVDVEENPSSMRPMWVRRRLKKTVDYITRRIGKPPTIYTAAWFWNQSVNSDKFGHCPLWVARYVHYSRPAYIKAPVPANPEEWGKYAMSYPLMRPAPVVGWGTDGWSAWQFAAGYNGVGKRYGMSSSDLDLNIVKSTDYPRFLIP